MEKNDTYYKKNIDTIISQKISRYKSRDNQKKREYKEEDYIDKDWVKEELIKNNCKCQRCNKELKTTGYSFRDGEQFSIDRIINELPHIKKNCQVVCLSCNIRRESQKLPLNEFETKKVMILIKLGLYDNRKIKI